MPPSSSEARKGFFSIISMERSGADPGFSGGALFSSPPLPSPPLVSLISYLRFLSSILFPTLSYSIPPWLPFPSILNGGLGVKLSQNVFELKDAKGDF